MALPTGMNMRHIAIVDGNTKSPSVECRTEDSIQRYRIHCSNQSIGFKNSDFDCHCFTKTKKKLFHYFLVESKSLGKLYSIQVNNVKAFRLSPNIMLFQYQRSAALLLNTLYVAK